MTVTLYELVGADDRRFSPYCWRTRMALKHKGLDVEYVPVKFTDKDKIAFSGQERVPVLVDDGVTVYDSWTIACHLEDSHSDTPTLFGGAIGRGEARFLNIWADRVLQPAVIGIVVKDIFDHVHPDDRAYFRQSREGRFGRALEDLAAGRDAKREALGNVLAPVRALLEEQPFICGDAPAYGDYILFGTFQWVRGVSDDALIGADDPVHAWRGRMLALYDGFALSTTAYPP